MNPNQSVQVTKPEVPEVIAICPYCKKLILPVFRRNVAPANSWVGEQDVDWIECPECSSGDCDYDSQEWQINDDFCLLEEKDIWIEFCSAN